MESNTSNKPSGSIVGQTFSQFQMRPPFASEVTKNKESMANGETLPSMSIDSACLRRNESVMFMNQEDVAGQDKESDQGGKK